MADFISEPPPIEDYTCMRYYTKAWAHSQYFFTYNKDKDWDLFENSDTCRSSHELL